MSYHAFVDPSGGSVDSMTMAVAHDELRQGRVVGVLDLIVERRGKALGGNNIQAVVGAPSEERYGLDEDVALWLRSGWWVSLRNEFAAVPDVAIGVLRAVADELEAITSRATESEGSEAYAVTQELFETELRATAPDHWR